MSAPTADRIIAHVDASRTVGTKGVPRAEREQQMLDCATEEFGAHGYTGAALSSIAARAGVSKPMVLSYFGSKDGLYTACVERAGANLIDRIEQVLTAGQGPTRMAQDTLAAIFAALHERPHDWNVLNDRTVPPNSAADQTVRRIRNTIAEQAGRGVGVFAASRMLDDPDDLSVLTDIWMNRVTAMVDWWLRHPDQTAEQMTRRSQRILAALTGTATLDTETR